MCKYTTLVGVSGLLAAALLAPGCNEFVGPGGPELIVVGDQQNSTLGESGTVLVKGFNPTNPHHGDAIVATFFWLGSTNIITSVTDRLTTANQTPVGNTYNLVDYVTAGGISMATYVATNVQNFPDGYSNPSGDSILAVQANLSQPVTDGGIMMTAYSGVYPAYADALGAHRAASGSGSSPTVADPGAVSVGAGSLAYAATMANALVGSNKPVGWTNIVSMSDAWMVTDGEYLVPTSSGPVDPQWTWNFSPSQPGSWLASVLTLNEAVTKLVFSVQPSSSLPCPVTIQPPVAVTAQDDQGNTVSTYNGAVTIAIKRNAGAVMPGTLSGTKTVQAVNGVARFGDLCIDQPSLPGNGYTLQAAVPSLNLTVESAAFGIGVGN